MIALLPDNNIPFSHFGRKFFSIFIFLTVSLSSHSQTGYFSESGEAGFPEKIEDIFKISSEKKRANDFIDQFEEFWLSPETPDEAKAAVLEISDLLYDKKATAFPDYHLFLSTVRMFVEQNQINENFRIWREAAITYLKKPRYYTRHFNELLNTTRGIIDQQRIFGGPGTDWYSRNPNYSFRLIDDTLTLSLPETRLVCHSRTDSIEIYNTSGNLNLLSGIWKGNKGRVTWERSGFEGNKVYATFDDYQIDMSDSDFAVKDAVFYNRHYFNGPLKGDLEHKVTHIRTPSSSLYPKFESYDQLFNINNIHPNLHYKGGFSQHGAKFLGSGTDQNPATISIIRNDTLFISARSKMFSLRTDEILSRETEVTIHLDTGEIHHPGLEFKYMAPNRDLYLIRSGEGISQSPFFDTYHNVSINSEIIQWNLDKDFMELRMLDGAAQNRSFFESLSFYRESFFNYLQGMDAIHPLFGLRNCYYNNDQKPFTAKDYARFLNLPESQVRQQVLSLSFHGFIDFNFSTDTIKINERLTDYIKFRLGKKDYDVIRFRSVTDEDVPNAIFDLKNYDLALNGVENVSISDHQNVIFLPENEKITLKRNRNFSFNGQIKAGMIELFGNGFLFTYDDFRIDMQNIDSMRMSVGTEQLDQYGRPLLRTIDNTVARLSGYLQIDTANNKSGINDYPHYPILVSDRDSYVYYDRPDIQNAAYNTENFYFELDPFEIDSINELNLKNIVFDGKLVSNIFPELEDQLVVRRDYSLGFVKQSPPEGYPIYNGKAQFTNEIDLSNRGLKGNGRLDYLTSSAESEDFTFLPEETNGIAHSFNIEPSTTGVEYPDVQAENVKLVYKPQKDQLLTESTGSEFHIFKKETSLKGALALTPSGLQAGGTLHMPTANLISEEMDLTHHALIADSADFNLIGGEEMDGVSFKTNNLIAQLDFEERQGRFTSRDMGNTVEFTENLYLAYISEFSWDMDQNDIYMGASGSEGNRFVSTHRRQDSLEFLAPLAVYDIETKTIQANEVTNIEVADADIILNDGIINIRKDAEMDPLDSTQILLPGSTHKFKNAHVKIEGKFVYSGYGEYDFINGSEKQYTLDFHNIEVNDEQHTIAQGTIRDNQLFTLDDHFAYKGDIELSADAPLLTFYGGTQMLHPCSQKGPQDYIRFNAPIDPNEVRIPIGERTTNTELERLSHDVMLQIDSTHVYSAFLEKHRRINNASIAGSTGHLRYNKYKNSFEIATEEKFANPDSAGHIIRFNEDECSVNAEGKLDFNLDLEQVKLFASGRIDHFRETDSVSIDALFGTYFMLDDVSINTMANAIRGSKAPIAKHEKETTEKRLREWMKGSDAKKLADLIQPTTDISEVLPLDLQHTLCFTDINFTWNTPSRSYVANGTASLGWIKDQSIAKEVEVKALVSRSRGGNSFEIHIKADENTWFFYSYNNGKMLILSSLDEFNKAIQALDIDLRKMKTGMGQPDYVFQLGSMNRLRSFMKHFNPDEPESEEETEDLEE